MSQILRLDKLVAAMVPAGTLQEFLDRRRRKEERSLAGAFEDLRRICEEEDLSLEIPPRQERPNPFPDALDEMSRLCGLLAPLKLRGAQHPAYPIKKEH